MTHARSSRTSHARRLVHLAGPVFVVMLTLVLTLRLGGSEPSSAGVRAVGFADEHPIATRVIRAPARLAAPAHGTAP